ncbi:hypothetical protein [Verminephrobacter aporrectodeae]|uniref:hypothetical protein n=1 Tax=Verminephrobacter aporrectodeae TaxID=1110389 RepID=UPI0022435EBB|nr:hypothetical protein [Verminephrobacter aporrectodeae]
MFERLNSHEKHKKKPERYSGIVACNTRQGDINQSIHTPLYNPNRVTPDPALKSVTMPKWAVTLAEIPTNRRTRMNVHLCSILYALSRLQQAKK